MIELLGVGVQDARNVWLFRKVCARLNRGTLSAVIAASPVESTALLDAVSGRRIPDEGRVWVTRIPLMRETRRRVRTLVGEAPETAVFATHRSVLWNTLVRRGTILAGLARFPRRGERQAALSALDAVGLGRRAHDPLLALSPGDHLRVAVARILTQRPAALLLRDVDRMLGPDGAASLLSTLRRLVRNQRLTAIVSLDSLELARRYADHVLLLANGALIPDTWSRDTELAATPRDLERVGQ